jgi:molybdopterin molybdotransferase
VNSGKLAGSCASRQLSLLMDNDSPQRIAKLTPLADVLARIDALVNSVAPREVAITAAVGRVLAGDVTVGTRPRVPLALRDGWAVSAELTTDASSYAPVPLPAAARIEVGEPMPVGADAVAPLDVVLRRHGQVEIIAPIGSGEGVLPTAADAAGQTLGQEGTRLTRLQAAALSATGVERAQVREPKVHLVGHQADDAVIDAAVDLIANEIVAAGGGVVRAETSSNASFEQLLGDNTADAIVAVGGTGCGRNDTSAVTLARRGRVEAHGIALAPGETAAFGLVGSRPVLLLPGRLDAALAVWLVIGRHLLARLTGCNAPEPTVKATLARKIASPLGLAEVVPVRVHAGSAQPIASGYLPLSALAQANGWVLVPAESEGYPPGSEVVIRPWP